MSNATISIIELQNVPFGAKVTIGGFEFEHKGFEKRKTKFGKQEHFILYCHETKVEKIYERYQFSKIKIKKKGDSYEWK